MDKSTANNRHSVPGPIGVFDSGYGGLTILNQIRELLPQYDYIYLGDNARAPYGTRSFDIVYRFTLEAVRYLFDQGCHLVILACNTASAKALRTIQQNDLPLIDPDRRVLGVIRPTVEKVGEISRNGNIGIVGTPGTIRSGSYELEIAKLHPTFHTYTQACPMWVPLVENREASSPGADYFVKQEVDRLMAKEPAIDTIILGCTHYPLLYDKIRRYVPESARVLPQGEIVAESLVAYLQRHPEMEAKCSKGGTCSYRTTESPDKFAELASLFIGAPVTATQIDCL
ncbi:glutamate racemase [uncultured Muribaculum sp.]|jgi:glutamate racemase|uniref:glutamate racemase n=2 Tax=uncultured Muribaculum sp. TaxID=1918613 RepID=UPI0025874825|nr:glutamate racemase [uncultured Muribaculum sp.]